MPNYSINDLLQFMYKFNSYIAFINSTKLSLNKLPYISGSILDINDSIIKIEYSIMVDQVETFVGKNRGGGILVNKFFN